MLYLLDDGAPAELVPERGASCNARRPRETTLPARPIPYSEDEMFARIATSQSQPEQVEEMIRRLREQTVPVMQGQEGFRGFYGLVDRKSGKALGISLWE